ncbi:MAG: hypothetical protein BWY56_01303 [Acidobacteria bacterium ADurb.Bin340]|nr:MAG: hypothetical protein BWY56_01303 [Acidobacteria bacterium ADurb.Bin340]
MDFATETPMVCTTVGRLGMASWSLFCTLDQAMSGSVPGAKVSVTSALPEESAVEYM